MLVQPARKQPGNDIEILVVMRGEPAGVALGFRDRASGWRQATSNFEFSGYLHGTGEFVAQASQGAEKGAHTVCHSERSEESLFLFMGLNRREIPRLARNDKINYFFCSLFRLRGVDLARTKTHRLKPLPLMGSPRLSFRRCDASCARTSS